MRFTHGHANWAVLRNLLVRFLLEHYTQKKGNRQIGFFILSCQETGGKTQGETHGQETQGQTTNLRTTAVHFWEMAAHFIFS